MEEGQAQGAGPAQRSVEIGVTVASALFGLIIIVGSLQVGIGWGAEGPKSGFFPFYLGVIIVAASGLNLLETARTKSEKVFADWGQLRKVLAITIPTAIYVTVIPWIGIYVSSMFLIAVFMMWRGDLSGVRDVVSRAAAEGPAGGLLRAVNVTTTKNNQDSRPRRTAI
jgi:putative tricarboxylic transport membrane protein